MSYKSVGQKNKKKSCGDLKLCYCGVVMKPRHENQTTEN